MSLLDAPLSAIVAAVKEGQATAETLARAALDRAKDRNPAINAICGINPEALDEARSVDARIKAGEALPLAGVPVLIKDNLWVKGLRIAQGSNLFADHIAPEDAEVVTILRKAGAVVVGISRFLLPNLRMAMTVPLRSASRTGSTPGASLVEISVSAPGLARL